MPSFDATCSVMSAVTSRSKKTNSVRSSQYAFNRVIIPGIGVAIQLPNGDVKIEYKDGSAITVRPDSRGGGVLYENDNGAITKYSKNHHQNVQMPYEVKEKLRHLPTVITHLVQPRHRNIR